MKKIILKLIIVKTKNNNKINKFNHNKLLIINKNYWNFTLLTVLLFYEIFLFIIYLKHINLFKIFFVNITNVFFSISF